MPLEIGRSHMNDRDTSDQMTSDDTTGAEHEFTGSVANPRRTRL